MNLYQEVYSLTHAYVRKGGKDNRNQQRKRMLVFAKHAQKMGAKSMAQVGRNHVTAYWKKHEHLSDTTLKSHWYAFRELWNMVGKTDEPPKPMTERERFEKDTDEIVHIILR